MGLGFKFGPQRISLRVSVVCEQINVSSKMSSPHYVSTAHSTVRTAGMYFNMVRTDLLEMCSLGPSNPPPLPLPPTTLSPYLVYYFDFNGTETSQTE